MNQKSEVLGRFLQLRDDIVRSHTISTWVLKGKGDKLGLTLVGEARKAILVGQVNARNSGANFAPLPAIAPGDPVLTLAEVRSWSLSEAIERISQDEIKVRELNQLYADQGGDRRITWTAVTDWEEIEVPAYPVAGIYVQSKNVGGLVPAELVLTGEKRISIDQDAIFRDSDELRAPLAPSPLRADGEPELTFTEGIKKTVGSWPDDWQKRAGLT